jgi:hypothetical protein
MVRVDVPHGAQTGDAHRVADDLGAAVHHYFVVRADVHRRAAVVRRVVDTGRTDVAAVNLTASCRCAALERQRVEREQDVARQRTVDGPRRVAGRERVDDMGDPERGYHDDQCAARHDATPASRDAGNANDAHGAPPPRTTNSPPCRHPWVSQRANGHSPDSRPERPDVVLLGARRLLCMFRDIRGW